MMSLSSICRRVGLKDLVLNVPVYVGASGIADNPMTCHKRVIPGNIIVRQRGTRFHPGNYVGMGKDHTLHALKEGHVRFERHKLSGRKWVRVEPVEGHVRHPIYTNIATMSGEIPIC